MARTLTEATSRSLSLPPAPPKTSTGFDGFSKGVVQGGLSTLKGIGTIGQKVLDSTANKIGSGSKVGSDIYRPGTEKEQRAKQLITPQTSAEKLGFGTEQLAEFFVPASKIAKVESMVNLLSKGLVNPIAQGAVRVAGKALANAIPDAAIRYAQTGGDTKEAIKTGITAGVARGAFATVGEGARALKIPERLYSTIFKNSKGDMLRELNANGLNNLRQTNPSKYDELVEQGIVREYNGLPVLNETLAEKALDRGLRGSIRSMANEVVGGALDAEAKVQQAVKGYTQPILFPEKQYVNVLRKVGQAYQDVGFGEISKEANFLASLLKNTKGSLSGEQALQLRRFLDKMRIASSFDKTTNQLSMTQANFKTLADVARKRLKTIPGIEPIMKDYSFYIDALESLAKEASRRENSQVISLIDSIFLGGGLSAADPAPLLTINVLRRLIQSGPGMTGLAQLLQKSVASPATIGTIGGISSGVQSQIGDQVDQTQPMQ